MPEETEALRDERWYNLPWLQASKWRGVGSSGENDTPASILWLDAHYMVLRCSALHSWIHFISLVHPGACSF